MAFPENIKLEAKRKAHFQCVLCKDLLVEVHHIIPQKDGGSDDLDNAAPLCARCHDVYGGNPDKQKQIRESRNLWWEICEKREANPDMVAFNQKLDAIQMNQQTQFTEIKGLMAEYYSRLGKQIELTDTATQFTAVTGVYIPPQKK